MKHLRLLAATFARDVADRTDRWIVAQHRAVEGHEGLPVCVACRRHPAWPCDDVVAATDRIVERVA